MAFAVQRSLSQHRAPRCECAATAEATPPRRVRLQARRGLSTQPTGRGTRTSTLITRKPPTPVAQPAAQAPAAASEPGAQRALETLLGALESQLAPALSVHHGSTAGQPALRNADTALQQLFTAWSAHTAFAHRHTPRAPEQELAHQQLQRGVSRAGIALARQAYSAPAQQHLDPASRCQQCVTVVHFMGGLSAYDGDILQRTETQIRACTGAWYEGQGGLSLRQVSQVLAAWAKLGWAPSTQTLSALLAGLNSGLDSATATAAAAAATAATSHGSAEAGGAAARGAAASVRLEAPARALIALADALAALLGGPGALPPTGTARPNSRPPIADQHTQPVRAENPAIPATSNTEYISGDVLLNLLATQALQGTSQGTQTSAPPPPAAAAVAGESSEQSVQLLSQEPAFTWQGSDVCVWRESYLACCQAHFPAMGLAGLTRLLAAVAALRLAPSRDWCAAAAQALQGCVHNAQLSTPVATTPQLRATAANAPARQSAQTTTTTRTAAPTAITSRPRSAQAWVEAKARRLRSVELATPGLEALAWCWLHREGLNDSFSNPSVTSACVLPDELAKLCWLVLLNPKQQRGLSTDTLIPCLWAMHVLCPDHPKHTAAVAAHTQPGATPWQQTALERLHGSLTRLAARELAQVLHVTAMMHVRPYKTWMTLACQQVQKHQALFDLDSCLLVVYSLASLHSPGIKRLDPPTTTALVRSLSRHVPSMTVSQLRVAESSLTRIHRKLNSRPLQAIVRDIRARLLALTQTT